jgi:hypothetical protein
VACTASDAARTGSARRIDAAPNKPTAHDSSARRGDPDPAFGDFLDHLQANGEIRLQSFDNTWSATDATSMSTTIDVATDPGVAFAGFTDDYDAWWGSWLAAANSGWSATILANSQQLRG